MATGLNVKNSYKIQEVNNNSEEQNERDQVIKDENNIGN